MKKLVSIVLALALVLLCMSAFAADDLTVTVEDTNKGQTYTIYKIFDAVVDEGRAAGDDGISYKIPSGKESAFTGNAYFDVDTAGNVTAKSTTTSAVLATPAFRTWAEGFGTSVGTFTGDGSDKAFEDLTDGYYFITTTTGTLITVTSIAPSMTVVDKNPPTEIDKEITGVADGSVKTDKEKAIAQVGTVVDFEVRIPIANGAINYAFKDDMSAGLTNNEDVTVYLADSKGADLPASPTAIASGDEGYGTLSYPTTGDNEIVISFRNAWLSANVGKEIVIRYSATVNADAVIADASNPNTARIEWGNTENPLTNEDHVDVYSAKIIVKKVDGDNQALEGAGFILKNADNEYYINTNGIVSWGAEADATEIFPVQATDPDTNAKTGDAVASFDGLPNGTYTLIEKTVPAGYNKAADQSLTIKDANANNLTTELTVRAEVTNNQGTELPSTGGIGTTIFYIVGGILLVGAAIILVSRRRAHN